MTQPKDTNIAGELATQFRILGTFVAIFWIVEILDATIFDHQLDYYGIIPHKLIGLRGIIFAPFLHGGWQHLIANTIPFIVLGWLVMLQEVKDFFIVTTFVIIISGVGTWLFGADPSGQMAVHIGASSLIYGYLGFLLFRGYFERNFASILLSILVFIFYGSVIWGVLPSQPGVSWQGHLFGLIGGAIAARSIGKAKRESRDS
ncbi:rhomboid family intramembrane serine protease [Spirulina sp. CS-785/01]|uniref:rhomboid family intramembrane serine protease n=1 Tax=Spirulina sp. CS-785/01 TaxID=3021716 RepID=UPI00232C8DBC|nr:rhomboid family intramembrane serine protease [Spirulina sp. CS-785/01]MDB9314469.1 rhomboid family intramembrane serine protease [Spirulina sp. CS-785/01]